MLSKNSGIKRHIQKIVLVAAATVSQVAMSGISGSDSETHGISGGDSRLRGISGGDSRVSGISGGDSRLRGISGGDSRVSGISGGDSRLRGISGGDSRLRGISGGDSRLRTGETAESSVGSGATGSSPLFASVAMGPVELVSVDENGGALVILGQTFSGDATDVSMVSVGDYVLAAGIEVGSLDVLIPIGETYVPGASEVRLSGPITDTDPATASLNVGNTVFDYSEHLVLEPAYSPAVGDVIDIVGIQPIPSGSVLLGISGGDSETRGISGGDSQLHGISGGDSRLRGISGGDSRLRGISGGDSR